MRKQAVISLAILSILAAGFGCAKEAPVAVSPTPAPAVTQDATPAPVVTPVASGMTVADIGAKLTSAGLTFTEKDETEDAKALASGSAVTVSTKFKVVGGKGTVRVTVMALNDVSKSGSIKSDVEAQWAAVKKISSKMNMQFVDVGAANVLVALSYENGDEETAAKAKLAVAKE